MGRTTPAREVALDVLAAVRGGRFAEDALSSRLDAVSLSQEDRALATELVYGVLRWRDRLDAAIARCSDAPGKKLRPQLREILRMALYQVLMLDRIPYHAAVDQAVTQARTLFDPRTGGFANAVLRTALRNRATVDPPPGSDAASLAQYYSHPQWLVERWLDQFGPERTRQVLGHNNSRSPLVLRVNTLKASPQLVANLLESAGVSVRPVHPFPNAFEVVGSGRPVRSLPGYEEGLFAVQGGASQMIALVVAAMAGERILDAAAAPGGKTAHLAALTNERISVTATDSDPRRLEEARTNLARLGVGCAELFLGDAADPGFISRLGTFDRVLLDAPCSNLGVLRHNPEAKYRLKLQDPEALARKQTAMLEATAAAVRHGGVLVYSVCTTSREETYGVVSSFLARHGEFSADPIDPGEVFSEEILDSEGFLATFPPSGPDPFDGFFAARMKRR